MSYALIGHETTRTHSTVVPTRWHVKLSQSSLPHCCVANIMRNFTNMNFSRNMFRPAAAIEQRRAPHQNTLACPTWETVCCLRCLAGSHTQQETKDLKRSPLYKRPFHNKHDSGNLRWRVAVVGNYWETVWKKNKKSSTTASVVVATPQNPIPAIFCPGLRTLMIIVTSFVRYSNQTVNH